MCGIVGWVGPSSSEAIVRQMVLSLVHRGPDAIGIHASPSVVLGAARLAITDVERGHQPVIIDGPNGTVAVCLNGEIYNSAELTSDLEHRGVTLRSHCDTELIAHVYREYGADGLGRLNGMYALAIWDSERRTLLLARGRIGLKPLHFAHLPSGDLVFSSELRGILQHPDLKRELDLDSLRQYFLHDAVPAPATMFRGIQKLEAGELVRWTAGKLRRTRVSELRFDEPVASEPSVILDQLDRRIRTAVRRRIPSEVPWGCFLSGGIDSSLITLMAAREGSVHTFSIGWEDADYDESAHARRVAEIAGATHHERRITDRNACAQVPGIYAHLDEPLGDESVVSTWLVSQLASEYGKVILTGDGGDELYLGYSTFIAERLAASLACNNARGRVARAVADLAKRLSSSHGRLGVDFLLRRFAAGLPHAPLRRHAVWLSSVDDVQQQSLLSDSVLARTGSPFGAVDRLGTALSGRARWDRITAFYVRLFLGEGLLSKLDRPAMAHGLEARAPLLDDAVLDYALALPVNRRIRSRRFSRPALKWPIRELAARYGLPRDLVRRKKQGFSAPNAGWLAGPLQTWMRDLLSPDTLRRGGLFRPEAVDRLVTEHVNETKNHRKVLWSLLAFRAWQDAWT